MNPAAQLRVSKNEIKVFCIALALCFIARGSALFSPTFNVDDLMYWPTAFDFHTVGVISLREGRFTGPLIAALEDALGIHAARSFALAGIALIVSQVVSALLICRLWKAEGDAMMSMAVVALLVLHPYQTDFFTWKMAMLNGGIPFVATFAALCICTRSRAFFVGAVLLIVLAFGIHQLSLPMAAAVLALALPIALVRGTFDRREWLIRVLALTLAVVAYVITAKIIMALVSHSESLGRDKIILLSAPALVLSRSIELVSLMTIGDPLIGWLARAMLGVTAMLVVLRIALHRGVSAWARCFQISLFALAIIAAIGCSISLTVVPNAWMPAFRNLQSASIVWAAIAVLALHLTSGTSRKVTYVVLGLIIFGFIGANNQILSDQQRSNRRDVALMTRIAYAVGSLERSEPMQRIAFVGTTTTSLTQIATGADFSDGWHNYGTTLSVFAVYWPAYKIALYNEVTGELRQQATPEETQWAEKECSGKSWPAKGSVFGIGPLAVVCLGSPAKFVAGQFDPVP